MLSALVLLGVVLLAAAALTRQFTVWHDEYSSQFVVERKLFVPAYKRWQEQSPAATAGQTPR